MSISRLFVSYAKEGARTACIMSAGDAVAQLAIERKPLTEYDGTRTAKFACLGLIIVGPTLRAWYTTLDKIISKNQPAYKSTLKKVVLDQACFAPTFMLFFTSLQGVMNGQSSKQIEHFVRTQYLDILKTNYMLWPAAQMINFSIVPLQYQVVFVQLVAVIWNCYLSNKLNEGYAKE